MTSHVGLNELLRSCVWWSAKDKSGRTYQPIVLDHGDRDTGPPRHPQRQRRQHRRQRQRRRQCSSIALPWQNGQRWRCFGPCARAETPLAEVGPTTRIWRILPWPASKIGTLRRVGRGALVVLLRGRPRRDADGHPPCACPSPSSRRAPNGRPPAHERRANARARGDVRRALAGRTVTGTHAWDDRHRSGGDVRAVGRPRGGRAPRAGARNIVLSNFRIEPSIKKLIFPSTTSNTGALPHGETTLSESGLALSRPNSGNIFIPLRRFPTSATVLC